MTDWNDESGPWPPPRRAGWRDVVKRSLLLAAAAGREPADPGRGACVLAYHATPSARSHPWWIDFPRHLARIEDLGFRVVTLDRVLEAVRSATLPAEPMVALTFDDGWADNLGTAFPELARRGWPGTVFVTTGFLDRRPFLRRDELARLADLGVRAEMHTHTHPDLRQLDAGAISGEISRSGDVLEAATGRRPRYFCYPFGHFDRRVRDAVAAAGVAAACTGIPGWNPPGTDPLLLRRVTLEPGDGPGSLRARLAGGDVLLAKLRRKLAGAGGHHSPDGGDGSPYM